MAGGFDGLSRFQEIQFFYTDLLKAGEWRLTEGCLMVGRGTDMEDLAWKMNLLPDDIEFLKGCRISV